MYMRFPCRNSSTRGVMVEDAVTRKLYRFKNHYTQVDIVNQFQAKWFYIPLSNDQIHRDMKYHRNTKENIMYRHVLMKISIMIIAGFAITVKTSYLETVSGKLWEGASILPVETWCDTKDRSMPEASYTLLCMMQPF